MARPPMPNAVRTAREDRAVPWQVDAACAGQDPENWVTPTAAYDIGRGREAIAVCAGCPVLTECDRWAQRNTDNRRGHIVGGVPYYDNGVPTHLCQRCGAWVLTLRGTWCERCTAFRDAAYRRAAEVVAA